jgi:hypothetical protein
VRLGFGKLYIPSDRRVSTTMHRVKHRTNLRRSVNSVERVAVISRSSVISFLLQAMPHHSQRQVVYRDFSGCDEQLS